MPLNELSLFRGRDFFVLCILILALYITFNDHSLQYSLKPAWFVRTESFSMNKNYFVKPIIGDLDGDGMNEIVAITKDFELQILMAKVGKSSREIYQPTVLASKKIFDHAIQQGKYPISMQIGYVAHYDALKERTQKIVVVTQDFSVYCYDHLLNLLWEKAVSYNSLDIGQYINNFVAQDVAAFVSPVSIRNSSGTVFIGLSMKENSDVVKNSIEFEMAGVTSESHTDTNRKIRSRMEHFNIFALDASTGHVLWRHDGLDIKTEQYTKSLPQSSLFKLELQDLMTRRNHESIRDWTVFRDSLLSELPHEWHEIGDAFFSIARFSNMHFTSNEKKLESKQSSKISNSLKTVFTGIENVKVPEEAYLPHSSYEHIQYPNVLVAHTSKGLEVVSLGSGKPITSLALSSYKTYCDVDGDSVVDTLLVLEAETNVKQVFEFADQGDHFKHCSLVVVSGLPARSQLFNGTLCNSRSSLQEPLKHRREFPLPERVYAAPPTVMRSVDKRTGMVSKVKDIVVAVNTGVVTAYFGSGELKWQLTTGPTWRSDFKAFTSLYDIDSNRAAQRGTHDSVGAHVLVNGENVMALISGDGDILVNVDIPNLHVRTRPVLGDFDSDGVTDVVLVSDDFITGYRLELSESTNGLRIALILLSAISVLIFIANIKTDINTAVNGKRIMSVMRSTDNYHID